MCLMMLKTFAMMRSRALIYNSYLLQVLVNKDFGKKENKERSRRQWMHVWHSAKNLTEFREIKILEPVLKEGKKKKERLNRIRQTISKSKSCINLSISDSNRENSRSLNNLRPSNSGEELTEESELGMNGPMLQSTADRLREARLEAELEGDSTSLKFLLAGVVKRNHLSLDDALIDDARSTVESGRHSLSEESRSQIQGYLSEVERCLDYLSNSKGDLKELGERLHLVRKLKQSTGCTALMLSGGGAQAMYHTGILRALIDSGLYQKIGVVSGTSGGSLIVGMCAIHTPEELMTQVLLPNLATDYKSTGEMKRRRLRFFPTYWEMAVYWLRNRILMDSKELLRACQFLYEDFTFEEAFQRTGKHVCITVSASRAQSGKGVQRLLLNHISTPHVTICSAIVASCALPGVMAPAKLQTKDKNGTIEPFEVDGVDWIDGSVQADIPFQRISTLFNVSNYVVCQANFHVVPFLHKPHHPNVNSLYWKLFQLCEWDMRTRALNLSRLGLFPKLFGQDISKIFEQKYDGKLTIVPRFTRKQLFGLNMLDNPTVQDMTQYLRNGQVATWPYLEAIEKTLRSELAIERALHKLEHLNQKLAPELQEEPSSLQLEDVKKLVNKYCIGRDTEILEKFTSMQKEILGLRKLLRSSNVQSLENLWQQPESQ